MTALFDCYSVDGCTLTTVMIDHGASAEAVAFAQAHNGYSFLSAFVEMGRVDLGVLIAPMAANSNRAYELLNGNPPAVDAQSARDDVARLHPAYATLYANYPELILWGSDSVFDGQEPRPDGGQRFLFRYPMLDGCHACDLIDWARAAYDFDAAGNFLGITYLEPASIAPAPPATASIGQIAYIDGGNIFLIDTDGSERQQITDSGADCCLAWSPDGRVLYFIRNAKTKDSPQAAPSGTILAYDFQTKQERVIATPDVNVSDSLAVSSDGRSLAFSTSDWVDVEAYGNVHKGCLYVMIIDTGEFVVVDCEAPGAIYDIAYSPYDASIAVEMGFYEGSRLAFYDSPRSPRVYDDRICCVDLRFAPHGEGFFTNGAGYGSWTTSLIYYENREANPIVLIEIPWEVGGVGMHDVSPDGTHLVYVRNRNIEIMDLSTRATTAVGVTGFNPVWRPDYSGATINLDSLLARKEATFDQLESITYESSGGVIFPEPIAAFDETAARELVASLRAADPATITTEQAAALERLVLQEETLAVLLDDYRMLAEDQADVEADLAGMTLGVALLGVKATRGWQKVLIDLARTAIEDFIKLWLYAIEDEAIRESARNVVEGTPLLIDAVNEDAAGLIEEALERWLDDRVRADAMAKLIPLFVEGAQPAVDHGVRSVSGAGDPVWPVEGSAESAAIQLSGLTDQSRIMRELAQDVYDDLGRGRDVNQFLTDAADIAVAGTRIPVTLIFSLQTRIQQILIDTAATSVISGAMTCTSDAAALSGEFAFQPGRPVYGCEVPVPLDLEDFFRRIFTEDQKKSHLGRLAPPAQSTAPAFDAALATYRAAVTTLRDALGTGDEAAVQTAAEELLAAAGALSDEAVPVMARLARNESDGREGEMALAAALTTVRLDAFFALLAADVYLADPESADAAAFDDVLLRAGENVALLERVQAQVPLPVAPDAALPMVDAPATWTAVAGQPLDIPVTVANLGGAGFAAARLIVELDGRPVTESPLPDLAAGETVVVAPEFTPDIAGRYRLRLIAATEARRDYRTVDLTVETAPSGNSFEEEGPPDAPIDPDLVTGGGQIRAILLGVMVISGALFVLGLIFYAVQRRRA